MLRIQKTLFLLGLLVIVAGLSSCKKDDDGPAPTTAIIKGNITLLNTEVWAAYQDSGEVQLTDFSRIFVESSCRLGTDTRQYFRPRSARRYFCHRCTRQCSKPARIQLSGWSKRCHL